MHKSLKAVSVSLGLALLVSVVAAWPASAAQEARVEIESGGGAYVTITNVSEEKPAIPLYIAEAPATVTFHGKSLCRETIEYFSDAELNGDDLMVTNSGGMVRFDVKKYSYIGQEEVLDELVQEPADIPVYVTGNYATLREPGYYLVMAGPEAAAPTQFVVQVVAQAHQEPAGTPAPEVVSAVPTSSKVSVNGKEVSFEAYHINGNNYFKLRDLAMVLNGTAKQFEVTWDSEKNAINLISGKAYTPVGGELAASNAPGARIAAPTSAKVYLDGQEVQFTAYEIGGNNYFKLRDIGKAIDFGVTWDANTSSIGIDSNSSYTE